MLAGLEDIVMRLRVGDLYAAYVACLDERRFDAWPELFTEDGRYALQPRENYDRGLPLATMALESRGMMRDRVYGVTKTLYHDPYYQRHSISGLQVKEEGETIRAEANYLVVRTKPNELTQLFNAGRYFDRIVEHDGQLKFAEKLAVFDSELIPNSIIYPI